MHFQELENMMHFQELEALTSTVSSSEILSLLPSLDEYLFRTFQKHQVITPIHLAKKLGTSEGVATVLVMLADEAGLLTPRYQVRCKESQVRIGTYNSKDDIPERISCPEHGRLHTDDEYSVELGFEFTEKSRSKN
jgi:hypothetical protein